MTQPFAPLTLANWQSAPSTRGRVAVWADVQAGQAAFHIPSGSKPYPLSLPACAIHSDGETGQNASIVVIQAEELPDQIVLGARLLDGGSLVCTLLEVEWVPEPDEGFFRLG